MDNLAAVIFYIAIYLAVYCALASVPALIAKKREKTFWKYFLLSLLVSPLLGLIIVIISCPNPNTQREDAQKELANKTSIFDSMEKEEE